MRKVLIALIATALVAVSATGGGSPASADNQSADWLAAGTATLAPPPQFGQPMLHVNAQSNTGGTNVRGHFWIRYSDGGGEFGGPIVCLNVLGQAALLYGQIEQVKTPRPTFTVGNYVPIRLLDGGEPGTLVDVANFDARPLRRTASARRTLVTCRSARATTSCTTIRSPICSDSASCSRSSSRLTTTHTAARSVHQRV